MKLSVRKSIMSESKKIYWTNYKALLFLFWKFKIKPFLTDNLLFESIFALFLLAYFLPSKIIISLPPLDNAVINAVLSRIVGALASILGIVVSILLVSFELLRKRYAFYALKEFFRNRYLKNLFVLFVGTILISTYALLTLKDPLLPRTLFLSYLSIFLFFLCMIMLYPSAKKILSSTMSKENIQKIVDRIGVPDINHLIRPRLKPPAADYVAVMEENPLFILSEVAIRSINEGDRLTPKLILVQSTKRLKTLLEDTVDNHHHRDEINAFLIVFNSCSKQALLHRQDGTLYTVLDVMREISGFCAEKKFPWHELIEFNEAMRKIIETTIEEALDDLTRHGVWSLKWIYKEHLEKNIPAENQIWTLNEINEIKNQESPDYEKESQWNEVSHSYLYTLDNLAEKAIVQGRGDIVSVTLRCFMDIASEIIEMRNLGEKQKASIIDLCFWYVRSLSIKCADKGLYGEVPFLSPFRPIVVKRILDKKAQYSKRPLIEFCDTLIKLAQRNIFNTYSFNELGAVGRSVVESIDKEVLHKEALMLICKTFDKIRESVKKSDNIEKEKANREIFRQVELLKKWMESKNKHDEIIEKEISSVLGKFEELKEYEGDTIKWPNLSGGGQ